MQCYIPYAEHCSPKLLPACAKASVATISGKARADDGGARGSWRRGRAWQERRECGLVRTTTFGLRFAASRAFAVSRSHTTKLPAKAAPGAKSERLQETKRTARRGNHQQQPLHAHQHAIAALRWTLRITRTRSDAIVILSCTRTR